MATSLSPCSSSGFQVELTPVGPPHPPPGLLGWGGPGQAPCAAYTNAPLQLHSPNHTDYRRKMLHLLMLLTWDRNRHQQAMVCLHNTGLFHPKHSVSKHQGSAQRHRAGSHQPFRKAPKPQPSRQDYISPFSTMCPARVLRTCSEPARILLGMNQAQVYLRRKGGTGSPALGSDMRGYSSLPS